MGKDQAWEHFWMKIPENCPLSEKRIDNDTHSSPNIHIIYKEVHRDNACDIHKASTERMQRTVHPWFIGEITKSLWSIQETLFKQSIEAGTVLVDRMTEIEE